MESMGLFIRQDEARSGLQSKVAMELQERLKTRAVDNLLTDGVEDSKYTEDTKPTTTLAWAWVLVVFMVIALAVWLMSATIGK
jgi:hypothetical protein